MNVKLFIAFLTLSAVHLLPAQTMLPVCEKGLWGFINPRGTYIHQPAYNAFFVAVDATNDNVYYVKENDHISLLFPDGRKIVSQGKFSGNITAIIDARYIITRNNEAYSLFTFNGDRILPDTFSDITYLNRDYFLVKHKKKFNVANGKGELIFDKYHIKVQTFSDYFAVSDKDSIYLMDTNGQTVSKKLRGFYNAIDKKSGAELSYLYDNNKFFLMLPIDGDLLKPVPFNSRRIISNTFVNYTDTFKNQYIYNSCSKKFLRFENAAFDYLPCVGKLVVIINGRSMLYDTLMRFTHSLPYTYLQCNDGAIPTRDSGFRFGIIDYNFNLIASPQYMSVSDFQYGAAIYQESGNSMFGVIHISGKTLITPQYENIDLDSFLIIGHKNGQRTFYETDSNRNITGTIKFNNISILNAGNLNSQMNFPNPLNSRTLNNNGFWFYSPQTLKYGLKFDSVRVAIQPYLSGYHRIGNTLFYLVWQTQNGYTNVAGTVVPNSRYGIVDYNTRRLILTPSYNYIDTQAIIRNGGMINIRLISPSRGQLLMLSSGKLRPLPYAFIASLSNGNFIALKEGKIRFGDKDNNAYGSYSDYMKQMTIENPVNYSRLNSYFQPFANTINGMYCLLDKVGNPIPGTTSSLIKRERFNALISKDAGLFGIRDLDGNWILANNYDFINDKPYPNIKTDSLFFVYNGSNRMGAMDKTGKIVISANFHFLNSLDNEGYTTGRNEKMWYVTDTSGQRRELLNVNKALPFSEGLAPVRIKGRWGYIDHQGELSIPADFSKASPFRNGLAFVKTTKGNYYITTRGVIGNNTNTYEDGSDYYGQYALARKKNRYHLINTDGEKNNGSFKSYEQQKSFNLLFAKRSLRMKIISDEKIYTTWYRKPIYQKQSSHLILKTGVREYHIFDANGNQTGAIKARTISPFEEGHSIIKSKGKYAVINASGQIIYGPTKVKIIQTFDSFIVIKEGKYMYIERFTGERLNFIKAKNIRIKNYNNIVQIWADGRMFTGSDIGIIVNYKRTQLADLNEDVTAVKTNDRRMQLLDSSGFYFNQRTFQRIFPFRNGFGVFAITGNSGLYINRSLMPWILECQYDRIELLSNNIARFEKDNTFGYINLITRAIIWKGEY